MSERTAWRHGMPKFLLLAVFVIALPLAFLAQGGRGGGGQRGGGGAPQGGAPGGAGARAAAPVDVTGYWVSLVTEDWIERMAPDSPPSGAAGARGGRGGRGGGAPQPAAATGEPCRAYGAGGSMRNPGRLNITWADDNTLKIDMDFGTQTRLLHFTGTVPPNTPKTLQGYSVATWEASGGGGGRGGGGGGGQRGGAPAPTRWGNLKVVTTNMTGGYLLNSRDTYSENAVLTESFIRHSDFGNEYLSVVSTIDDAGAGGRGGNKVVSSTFKKEPDGSKFAPSGCDVVR